MAKIYYSAKNIRSFIAPQNRFSNTVIYRCFQYLKQKTKKKKSSRIHFFFFFPGFYTDTITLYRA